MNWWQRQPRNVRVARDIISIVGFILLCVAATREFIYGLDSTWPY